MKTKTETTTKDAVVDKANRKVYHNQRTQETLEKEHRGSLICENDLDALGYIDFHQWLKKLFRYGNINGGALIFQCKDKQGSIKITFFTSSYQYFISARIPLGERSGYLGCVVSKRKPRAGEIHTRGNDLPDGKYNEETFNKIVYAIARYEIKNLQCWA